jgi:hypothetical protein
MQGVGDALMLEAQSAAPQIWNALSSLAQSRVSAGFTKLQARLRGKLARRNVTGGRGYKRLKRTVDKLVRTVTLNAPETGRQLNSTVFENLFDNGLYWYQGGILLNQGDDIQEYSGRKVHVIGWKVAMSVRSLAGTVPHHLHIWIAKAKDLNATRVGTRFFGDPTGSKDRDWTSYTRIDDITSTLPMGKSWKLIKKRKYYMPAREDTNGKIHGRCIEFFQKFNMKQEYLDTAPATPGEFDVQPRVYMFWWVTPVGSTPVGTVATPQDTLIDAAVSIHEYFKP